MAQPTVRTPPKSRNQIETALVSTPVTSTRAAQRARFETIYQLHYGVLWAYARRRVESAADADDVAAQTWLTIWRRIEVLPQANELPWCYGVARRCLANHRRSTTRRLRLAAAVATERALDPLGTTSYDADTVDEVHQRGAPARQLRLALSRLSDDDQEILRLAAWEQLSHAEIAIVIETSTPNVAVRLHRAKQRLATALQDLKDAGHIAATTPIAEPKGTQ